MLAPIELYQQTTTQKECILAPPRVFSLAFGCRVVGRPGDPKMLPSHWRDPLLNIVTGEERATAAKGEPIMARGI